MTRRWSRSAAGILVVLLVCCVEAPGSVAGPPPANAAPVPLSPAVVVSPTPADEQTTVLVTLRGGADLGKALAGAAGAGRPSRLRAIQGELRSSARDAQAPLLSSLQGALASGEARAVTQLWISNSIRVTATQRVVRAIARRSDVVAVTPDSIQITPAAGLPSDNQLAIHAPTLWNAGRTGQGAVVASLDSGVDATHVDLAGRWRGGTNSWFDPYGQHATVPTDLTGHGTGVMGAMVAGDSSGPSLGTAPGASWIAARVFNDSGTSSISAIHQAFQWLLDPDGNAATADAPNVVNASWSIGAGPGCDLTFQPDVQALRAAGILTVFPAGNFGSAASSSVSPANYPESLSVGAVSASQLIYSASSRGPSTCGGRTRAFPDVVAPGVNILTTDRYGLFQYQTGTSVASPHVAGTLALLLGAKPGLSADVQQQVLLDTAADLGTAGVDETYGHGLVDASAAYAALPVPQPGFGLGVAPTSVSVEAGVATALSASITPVNGFTSDVTLSVTGVPANVSAAFTPTSVTGGSGTSVLTISAGAAATPGPVTLHVSATDGTLTRQVDVTLTVTAPPPSPAADALYFSTAGNGRPPGIDGTPDDADLYHWSGSSYDRTFDATAVGLSAGAAVDGFDRVDDTHFYLSFSADTTLVPGLGSVPDEDVVYYDHGTWSITFDGKARGLTSSGADLDAISIVGSTVYFSTLGNVQVPGVKGTADNADIYAWDGSRFARVWDATVYGLPASTDVDGVVRVDAGRYYLSFAPDLTSVPGLGAVEDEDVVYYDTGRWTTYFDGTAHGLGGQASLDVNAFDLP